MPTPAAGPNVPIAAAVLLVVLLAGVAAGRARSRWLLLPVGLAVLAGLSWLVGLSSRQLEVGVPATLAADQLAGFYALAAPLVVAFLAGWLCARGSWLRRLLILGGAALLLTALPYGALGEATATLLSGAAVPLIGRVVSVNLAVVRTDPWTSVKAAGATGIDKRPAQGQVRFETDGVAGDTIVDVAHHGGPEQAAYAYASEDLAFWAAELGRAVGPGNVGENLTTADVDCSGAVIGERWRVGAAEVRVTAPRIPCRMFAAFLDVPDMVKRFIVAGRPGCYLAVDVPGPVAAGDAVEVLHRPDHAVTVAEMMAAIAGRRDLVPRIATARADLGPSGRRWLDRALGPA